MVILRTDSACQTSRAKKLRKAGSETTCISLVVSLLDHYIIASSADEHSSDDISFITFMVKQLKLYQTPKLDRRYSVELITIAFL